MLSRETLARLVEACKQVETDNPLKEEYTIRVKDMYLAAEKAAEEVGAGQDDLLPTRNALEMFVCAAIKLGKVDHIDMALSVMGIEVEE